MKSTLALASLVFVLLAALTAQTTLAQSNGAPAAGGNETGAPGATAAPAPVKMPYQVLPAVITAVFRIDHLEASGVNFNQFGVEFAFATTGFGGLSIGACMELGSSDLAGTTTFIWHLMGDFGTEIPLIANDGFAMTFDVNGRVGLSLLNLNNTGNNLWYLPLEMMIGPLFYLGNSFVIHTEFQLLARLGITASNGGTPNSLAGFGFSIGAGLRF
ncbi:MAG: hypothetical protein AB7K09_17255 [Planctomycetota bacterium]